MPEAEEDARMFGDYPVEGRRYWVWLAGLVILGLASLVVAMSLR